ncbi:MAG TPA: nucleotidyltransferase domain-containing protein [Methanobacterium sp.]|nr:nucleotidyltransferase domain-containing protein [Methanobacterium sp.]
MGSERIGDINSFLHHVKKKFNPELVLLFGSRARNDYLKESDYDFIIVSRKFENIHFLKRIEQVLMFWDLDQDVDILPYTPEEFERKKYEIGIVNEALKEGIILEDRFQKKAVQHN